MRTVSLFNPEGGETGAGRKEADKGLGADGELSDGEKFVDEMSSWPVADGDDRGIGGLPVFRAGN